VKRNPDAASPSMAGVLGCCGARIPRTSSLPRDHPGSYNRQPSPLMKPATAHLLAGLI
jgi:hypothetical protein